MIFDSGCRLPGRGREQIWDACWVGPGTLSLPIEELLGSHIGKAQSTRQSLNLRYRQ